MQAWEIRHPGNGGLALASRAAPVPGRGEVVVAMRAAALNYRDLAILRGEYDPMRAWPLVPGSDGAGVVERVGEDVRGFAPGQRVVLSYVVDWHDGPMTAERARRRLGGPLDGTLAEQVLVPAGALVPIPDSLSFEHAATLPVAGVTAWRALFELGSVRPGATVVVEGTGGVSLFALQLAWAAGARVIVTGRSAKKLAIARELGAWEVIDTTVHAWEKRVVELTGGRGADVVLEVVGGPNVRRAVEAARIGGTVVVIGFLDGREAELDIPTLVRRSVRLEGISVGSRADLAQLVGALGTLRVTPSIGRTFPFAEVDHAFEALAAQEHLGKVVVQIGGG